MSAKHKPKNQTKTKAVPAAADAEVSSTEMEQIEAIVLQAVPDVSPNPAQVEWPTDPWGLTRDLKTAILRVGSRTAGHEDKRELVNKVLIIALAHLKVKFDADAETLQQRLAEAE